MLSSALLCAIKCVRINDVIISSVFVLITSCDLIKLNDCSVLILQNLKFFQIFSSPFSHFLSLFLFAIFKWLVTSSLYASFLYPFALYAASLLFLASVCVDDDNYKLKYFLILWFVVSCLCLYFYDKLFYWLFYYDDFE